MSIRASIVIATHNEGPLLAKTVASTADCLGHLDDWEIVVADDASTDDSIDQARRTWPSLRVVRFPRRSGCPAAKDLGARAAKGRVLVFLDGHCKPEPCSLERLIADIEELGDTAVVTPRIPALDPVTWENAMSFVGHGFRFDLEDMACRWVGLGDLVPRGRFFETPAAVGCCLAMSRRMYHDTGGFDSGMFEWGIEDIDFSLRVWLLGHSILHDPAPMVGHRFRASFDTYSVASESVVANQIRMARKSFSDAAWNDWLVRARDRVGAAAWDKSWAVYRTREASVEAERNVLLARRQRDETWYARRFGLAWPGH